MMKYLVFKKIKSLQLASEAILLFRAFFLNCEIRITGIKLRRSHETAQWSITLC